MSEEILINVSPVETRVALVENGTTTRQRVVTGTLSELEALAGQVTSPSLMIIGSVVSLRGSLRWF